MPDTPPELPDIPFGDEPKAPEPQPAADAKPRVIPKTGTRKPRRRGRKPARGRKPRTRKPKPAAEPPVPEAATTTASLPPVQIEAPAVPEVVVPKIVSERHVPAQPAVADGTRWCFSFTNPVAMRRLDDLLFYLDRKGPPHQIICRFAFPQGRADLTPMQATVLQRLRQLKNIKDWRRAHCEDETFAVLVLDDPSSPAHAEIKARKRVWVQWLPLENPSRFATYATKHLAQVFTWDREIKRTLKTQGMPGSLGTVTGSVHLSNLRNMRDRGSIGVINRAALLMPPPGTPCKTWWKGSNIVQVLREANLEIVLIVGKAKPDWVPEDVEIQEELDDHTRSLPRIIVAPPRVPLYEAAAMKISVFRLAPTGRPVTAQDLRRAAVEPLPDRYINPKVCERITDELRLHARR